VQSGFPVLIWWVNGEVPVTICPEVVGRSLFGMLGVHDLAGLVQFQNVCKDRVDLLDRTRFASIQRKIFDPFQIVVRSTGQEIGKRSECPAEAIAEFHDYLPFSNRPN
jgi:hypothetical protein